MLRQPARPYFPKSAWTSIVAYLKRGGGLISFGGAPFKQPVRQGAEDGGWVIEPEQTAYHQQLHIHETLKVNGSSAWLLRASDEIPLLDNAKDLFDSGDSWNLVPHVTKSADLPHQMGSAGPMDARIYPLLKAVSADGRERAAPVVLWEHVGGPYAGGRWMFVNEPLSERFAAGGGAGFLHEWAAFCAGGVTELWIKPNYASYASGEQPMLTFQSQRICSAEASSVGPAPVDWTFQIVIDREDRSGQSWQFKYMAEVTGELDISRIPITLELRPGFYKVICKAESSTGEVRFLRQGFWGMDESLLKEGSPIVCGKDYFWKDGEPLPVVGMTYMTSDVARKFLFLPNVDAWNRDMAHMRKAGINWIRTGIWTAYRNVMQVDGHASEEVLRAIDAFLQTARKHDLHVTFTFFSFTPETWEGGNPYLDPRSVNAQKRFIRSIVTRHSNTSGVDWDLINEPSMFDPARIFASGPRSGRDAVERAAFVEWLRKRHGRVELLQERWNMTPDELPDFAATELPEPEDINFDVQDMHQAKKGTRWLDYSLFSMEMLNRWAKELYATIKEACPTHAVTIGQDEALGAQRPSPFFYGEAVDYTTVHTWWLNDHLVWSGAFAKTADKPSLVQETGIMYVETPDGRAKRSEAELHHMLERKYAYSFATGGAGAIQWIWNTNFYMNNANESHIGALRADGTEKPEASVSYDFGRFMNDIRGLLKERVREQTAVVFPYSNDLSNRRLAFDATTTASRVLAYDLKLPFRAVSEYDVTPLAKEPAKLVIFPSPHNIDDDALNCLLDVVSETGAVLLLTGPAGLDAYWRKSGRLTELLGSRELANVRREERLELDGGFYPVSFGARRIAEASKEIGLSGSSSLVSVPIGRGKLLWSPLPVELNDRQSTVAALYRHAADLAGCVVELEWIRGGDLPGIYGRKLSFRDGALYVFISESGDDADIEIKDIVTGCGYAFRAESERAVLFAVDRSGKLLSVFRPEEVAVEWTRPS
ncbi:beta-galactosidase [Cohnella faecalis]|uniref:beta-galactosidase n=1 Tax=Cohnella faecalis TaxID=2315694 RepID=UPI002D76DA65|nr:beta-galactosidase [Cohnella faecalis]